jgi:outer membrane lipoprotein SlyB
MRLTRIFPILVLLALTPSCATTTTTATTWGETGYDQVRYGQVTWVREYVQHEHGDPVGGAVAGAIIGGILSGGRGPGMLIGAAVGAGASQGRGESRYFDIAVQFQDGSQQIFRYPNYPPFQPGEPVVQTPQGLARQ